MGRVYLKYGKPSDKIKQASVNYINLSNRKIHAFQIWFYDRIADFNDDIILFSELMDERVAFIFVDLSGDGNLTQIYSNVEGEKIDPRIYESSLDENNSNY